MLEDFSPEKGFLSISSERWTKPRPWNTTPPAVTPKMMHSLQKTNWNGQSNGPFTPLNSILPFKSVHCYYPSYETVTLKFFSLMVKSCSVHPSPIIAILRQWTPLRHLIRQIVICIVHFLCPSVIQHLKDSIQTILLSHRHLKKGILLLGKETMTPPRIGESKR